MTVGDWTWVDGTLLPKLLPCSSMPHGLICPKHGVEHQCVLPLGLWVVVQAGESSSICSTGSKVGVLRRGLEWDCSLILTVGDPCTGATGFSWGTFSPEKGKGGRWTPANRSEKEGYFAHYLDIYCHCRFCLAL